jgi:hypothetical protein
MIPSDVGRATGSSCSERLPLQVSPRVNLAGVGDDDPALIEPAVAA